MKEIKCTYVLINEESNKTEMATDDDFQAWAFYRDFKNKKMQVWIQGNIVAETGSFNNKRRSGDSG